MKNKRVQVRCIFARKASLLKVAFAGWILLLCISGCNQTITSPSPSETAYVSETLAIPVLPTIGETPQMTPSLPTPAAGNLQGLIEKAKEDLAQRLAISPTQINLMEITEVEWSDSSLGCPQPGMDYLQVITPGYFILLEVNAQTYEYHSNRDTYFVYCQNSTPPSVPKP